MRSFWSTLAGALIGLTGGPLGAGFGIAIGFLVDLVAADLRVQRETRRFIETGQRPEWLSALLPLSGLVTGAVAPASTVTSRVIAALEQRLADQRPDRFAARLCERAIAVAAGAAVGVHDAARRVEQRPLEERRRVTLIVWKTLRDEQAPRVAFERLATLAALARIEPGFIERELPARAFLDPQSCAVLGVGTDADAETVRHSYRRLAAQFHPDTVTALSEEQQQASTEAFVRIRSAYENLMRQISGSEPS